MISFLITNVVITMLIHSLDICDIIIITATAAGHMLIERLLTLKEMFFQDRLQYKSLHESKHVVISMTSHLVTIHVD